MRWSNYKMSNVPATATVIDEQPKPTSMRTVTKQTGVGRFRIDGFSGWGPFGKSPPLILQSVELVRQLSCVWAGQVVQKEGRTCVIRPHHWGQGQKILLACSSSFVANKFFALKKTPLSRKARLGRRSLFLISIGMSFLGQMSNSPTDRLEMPNGKSWCILQVLVLSEPEYQVGTAKLW